ncbi:MAG: tRNA 2-thiouridine(34) synthase MnmA [Candidatus Rokubacteria bacterium]|nr:tRNA 2-thiouridine(34) synthase MnmA [Candidatus Rokubacteria bacterium]
MASARRGERIVVGMSGGVDSSVAAALLVEQEYDVVGVTLRVWPWREPEDPRQRFGSCCSPETVDDARQVARRLGIPYYLLNHEREFDRTVIADFIGEYRAGRTPSPCVVCNREVKFGTLLRRALAWEALAVATGHYARITRDATTGRLLLWKAKDGRKDQSDFLWPLTQAQLAAARFPVGELTKGEVRARARALGLVTADKPESQEICFIPDDDYRGFLQRQAPDAFAPGPVVDRAGRVLGTHRGLAAYTVGQRRGLGVSGDRPLYVLALDRQRNAVVVGEGKDLETDHLVASSVNFIAFDRLDGELRVAVKIRHSHTPAPATLSPAGGDRVRVRFDAPQRAVTPGQSAVFYQGDLVIGGGIIDRA